VRNDQLSVRNPRTDFGLVLLCLYRRPDVSICGAASGSVLAWALMLVSVQVFGQRLDDYVLFHVGLAWIGSLFGPCSLVIWEKGFPRMWLAPLDDEQDFQEESQTIGIELSTLLSSDPSPVGSVMFEVRGLIKP